MIRVIKTGSETIKKEEFNYFTFVPLLGEDGWKK